MPLTTPAEDTLRRAVRGVIVQDAQALLVVHWGEVTDRLFLVEGPDGWRIVGSRRARAAG